MEWARQAEWFEGGEAMRNSWIGLLALSFSFTATAEDTRPLAHTVTVEYEHSGRADLSRGALVVGRLASTRLGIRWTGRDPATLGDWRIGLGVSYQLQSLDCSGSALLPDTLHGVSLPISVTRRWQRWRMVGRFAPGLFSDLEDLTLADMNAPGMLLGSYGIRPGLDLILGLRIDPRNELPVLGGPGLRLRLHDDWTLNLALPNPHLSWRNGPGLEFNLGGELVGGSYRVAERFGTRRGNPSLDDAQLTYREIRAKAECRWQVNRGISVSLAAGAVLNRRATYADRDLRYTGGAVPFGRIRIRAGF